MAVTVLGNQQTLDYIAKDFNSVVDDLISFANVNYGPGTASNRIWSNFNSSSFSRTWLEINAFVSDLLLFYFDQQATQSYLQTASIRSSIKDIAAQFGFTPASAVSASGDAYFTTTGSVTIPGANSTLNPFRVSSDSGVQYFVVNSYTTPGAGTYPVAVIQGLLKQETFTAKGVQNEEIELIGPNVIIDSSVGLVSPLVKVGGSNVYSLVDSFIYQNGTDSAVVTDVLGEVIGGGGRAFMLLERPNGTPYIRFGDGIFGRKLVKGENISITYRTDGGSKGNIEAGSLTTLVDSLSGVASVTNAGDFSGGADEQSIEQLRDLIPASLRTLERAVAEGDYADLLKSKFSEVLAAASEANTEDFGVDLNIYVVPQATSVTAITDNSLLYAKLSNYIDRRKMVTTQFQILDAYGVDTLITLEVFIEDTASKSSIIESLQAAFLAFFNLQSGGVEGTGIGFAEEVLLKDIDNIVESVAGIKRFEIKKLSYRPRIQMNVQSLSASYIASPVEIYPNVSESEWFVAASGEKETTASTILFGNSTSIGFTYEEATGKITYASDTSFRTLSSPISPGDLFRNGPARPQKTKVITRGDNVGLKEKTKITTISDQQGVKQKTRVVTLAGSSLVSGMYFIIYDESGSVGIWYRVDGSGTVPSTGTNRVIQVNVLSSDSAAQIATKTYTAINADTKFTVPAPSSSYIDIELDTSAEVNDSIDGLIPTSFTITTLVFGSDPNTLHGRYFDIYDNSGPVRFYLRNNSLSPIIPATPSGGRMGGQINFNNNDSAATIADNIGSVIGADAQFDSYYTSFNGYVEIEHVVVMAVPHAVDYNTEFTFEVVVNGTNSDTLNNKYFVIYSSSGEVCVWYNVAGGGTQPSGFGDYIEITTVVGSDSAATVASKTQAAVEVEADSDFTATYTSPNTYLEIETATSFQTSDSYDVTAGFTVTTEIKGVGSNADFEILSVDNTTNILYLNPDLPVNPVAGSNAGGSIRSSALTYEEFTCFKRILADTTGITETTITDSNLNLSVFSGTAAVLQDNVLIDNNNVFTPDAYIGYYVVDGASNIFLINDITDNKIITAATAVNDASIYRVSSGEYKIVKNYTSSNVLFNGSINTIEYNNHNTIFAFNAYFNQIGTIGDPFIISTPQTNKGVLGVAVNIIDYDISTKLIRLNGAPDLQGINNSYILLDSSGEEYNVTGVDNRLDPTVSYLDSAEEPVTISSFGANIQLAQGFEVPEDDSYSIAKVYLKRTNAVETGFLFLKIVEDDGTGLPDLTKVVKISESLSVDSISQASFSEYILSFSVPAELSVSTQYHLVIVGNAAYTGNVQINGNSTGVYIDGEATTYDGSTWTAITGTDFYFEVAGTKSITIESNLIPSEGTATISKRYYDDNNEISFVLGIESGLVTKVDTGTAVNDYGKGEVDTIPDQSVDTFVFRTSPYSDDIVNLRKQEIPQLQVSDIIIDIFGGVN